MKKMLMMVALAFATLTMNAQSEAGTVTIQPMVGGVMSNLTGKDVTTKYKLGLVAGAEVGYQISDEFAVSGGILYAMQGCKSDENSTFGMIDKDSKISASYLNIPILANYYVYKGLALKAGVQPALNLSANLHILGESVKIEDYKSFMLSIPVGVSYEISNVVLDFRYNIGVTEVEKDTKMHNSAFQLTLGYKLPL